MEEFSMSENAKDLIQQEIDRNPFLVLSKLVYQQIYREIINGNLLPQHRIVESKRIECFPLSGENGFGRDDRKGNTGKSKGQRIKSKENKL